MKTLPVNKLYISCTNSSFQNWIEIFFIGQEAKLTAYTMNSESTGFGTLDLYCIM